MPKPTIREDGKIAVALKRPTKEAGVELPALTMRPPCVKDQLIVAKMAGKSEAEREVQLFANLCEVTPDAITALTLGDYRRLQKAYTAFLTADEEADEDE